MTIHVDPMHPHSVLGYPLCVKMGRIYRHAHTLVIWNMGMVVIVSIPTSARGEHVSLTYRGFMTAHTGMMRT